MSISASLLRYGKPEMPQPSTGQRLPPAEETREIPQERPDPALLEPTAQARLLWEFPDIVLVLSSTGDILWANASAERTFRRCIDEEIGSTVLNSVHPDDLELVLRSFESVQEKERGNPIEIRARVRDEWRLFELIGRPVGALEEGAILFSLRDLTDRRRFEVARDDVARFRSLVHNSTAITLLVTPTGHVQSVSGAMTRLLGLDPEVVEGARLTTFILKDDQPAVETALRAALGGASAAHPVVCTARLLRHDSTDAIDYEFSIVNLMEDPTVKGLVVTAHDISDRVASELELKSTMRELTDTFSLLNATLEATANGILVVGRDRRVTSFNHQFVKMWHVDDELIQAGDSHKLVASVLEQLADPDTFQEKVEDLYRRENDESEDVILFKDGRVFQRSSKPQFVDGEVVGRVWSFSDVTARKKMEDDLAHMAFRDDLTGLANRALFRDRLSQAIARTERSGKYVAVMLLDVDNFKTVNDSLGHLAGDDILQGVALNLRCCLRRSDTASRLGGDEFAVLIEDGDSRSEVIKLAERILEHIREPIDVGGRSVSVTASIGVTFGTSGIDGDQLLRNADLAMYLAKAQGKNRYEEFQDQMHQAVVAKLELETDLHRALAERQFTLDFQPIVELSSDEIIGLEALVRWNHPTRGTLLPSDFIPFAEEIGLVREIDDFVLDEACAQLARWQSDSSIPDHLVMSVNFSAREIADPTMATRIREVLAREGLEPGRLILEVTESAVVPDLDVALQQLLALKNLGLRIALDDFGTGYSSLSHLGRLPIDILKIDRAFVRDQEYGLNRVDLADTIVRIARSLNVLTIAEGVEESRQVERLLEIGCTFAQGFLLGKPESAEATTARLRGRQQDSTN